MNEPDPMSVEMEDVGDITYVRLHGDGVWAYTLWNPLLALIDRRRAFVVDLRGLTSINDLCISDLLQGVRWGSDYHVDVAFIRGNAQVQQVFADLGATEPFRWVDA